MKKSVLTVLVFLVMFVSANLVLADGSDDLWEKVEQLKTWLGVAVFVVIFLLFCAVLLYCDSAFVMARLKDMKSQAKNHEEQAKKFFFLVFGFYPLEYDQGLEKSVREKIDQEPDVVKKSIMELLAKRALMLPLEDQAADKVEKVED